MPVIEAIQRFIAQSPEWLNPLVVFLTSAATLYQLAIIAVLFVPALLLSRVVEPRLEERARLIKGMPGLLRIIVAFLRRSEWLFFAALLAIANIAAQVAGWPENTKLLQSAAVLAASWLFINAVSHVIRSKAIRSLFVWLAWIYVSALILGIVDDVVSILDAPGFTLGDVRVTPLLVLRFAILAGILVWSASSLGNFFDRRIQNVDELTPSLRVLLGKVTRISLFFVAALLVLQAFNINLTALTVLSGAVGVGIGFGLQKVVSNFISGIIILLDQSIKPGDTITLGETFGWIRELRARFVSVVTRDGREFLIPNEDFITTQVVNWSFSDRFVRLDVDFGVSYDSDPHEVTRLAIEAASGVERVNVGHKAPVCWMTEFGDSSLNFRLRFWIDDPEQGLTNIRGKVLLALWDTFKEHEIGIPFPHREVIFRTPLETIATSAPPED
ncbi:MAG: mechanosensitive ion channel domain-containing protein [Woeseiaceae bacterium]|nr:mechanosensitive ion channel domain-containing protein [Woeseiaceae bacterium]